jgi:methyl acetate hydrolase
LCLFYWCFCDRASYLLARASGLIFKKQMTASITRREALLRTAAVASASVSLAAPLTGIAAPLSKPTLSEIDRGLQARVSAREIPGVVAMAANQQSVIYEGAFGFRDTATASRMSIDTIFRIASMVKLLTSVAALQLVDRGKLKLDEPAGNIDPTLRSAQVLAGFDAKGIPQLRAAQPNLKPAAILFSWLWHSSLS